MQKPFFSIITATYNSAKTLEKCFNSLFEQSFENWELIVIDGASTDETLNIIKKHQKNITKVISEKDSGIYDAMNKGANLAKGKYLYFLNSDDQLIDETVLEDVYQAISQSKKDIDLLTARVKKIYPKFSVIKNNQLSLANLRRGKMPPHQSMFVRRTLFKKIGAFKLKYRSSGDFEFTCRLALNKPKYLYLDRPIAHFSAGGMSANKKISYLETTAIIKNYFGGFYAALYYLKRVVLEQGTKKLLKALGCQGLIDSLTRLIMGVQ